MNGRFLIFFIRPRLTIVPSPWSCFFYDLELALAGWSRLSAFSFLSIIIFLFKARLLGKGGPTDLLDYLHGHIDGVQLARFLCGRKIQPFPVTIFLSRPFQHLGPTFAHTPPPSPITPLISPFVLLDISSNKKKIPFLHPSEITG
jgi:hypothetical protein